MKRKILSVVLSIVLSASMVMPAFAAENVAAEVITEAEEESSSSEELTVEEAVSTEVEETVSEAERTTVNDEADSSVEDSDYYEPLTEVCSDIEISHTLSNEDMYEGYINKAFGIGSQVELQGAGVRESLNEYEKNIYDYLKAEIEKIAAGTRTDTIINIPSSAVGLQYEYSAEDLQLGSITYENYTVATEKIQEIWLAKISMKSVINALVSDMPYELFWFDVDSTAKKWCYDKESSVELDEVNSRITFPKTGIYVDLKVAEEFRATKESDTSTNASMMTAPKEAAKKAQDLAASYASLDDADRLDKYREEICNRVSFDASVTASAARQLVSVFDENTDTNVSSAGYASAFQYLCDNSEFKSNKIKVYTLNGSITEETSGLRDLNHVWNMVHMNNDANYFVDITYCDAGQIGASDKLFLVGGDTQDKGFLISVDEKYVGYGYRSDIKEIYNTKDYPLNKVNYYSYDYSGLTNANLRFEWDSIISKEKVNGYYLIHYKAYARCKCGKCLKEDPNGKENVVASGTVQLEEKYITVKPSCDKEGKLGVGLTTSEKDFLNNGSAKRKVPIPSTPVEKYGEHIWGPEKIFGEGTIDEVKKKQCSRCGLIDEEYTKKTPSKCDAPTGLTAEYGSKLKDVIITNKAGNTDGTWTWQNPEAEVGEPGIQIFSADFTPSDSAYSPKKGIQVSIEVTRIAYAGNKEVTVNLGSTESCYVEAKLPELPVGAKYGTPSVDKEECYQAKLSEDGKVLILTSKGFDVATDMVCSIPVTGAKYYKDYAVTVTVKPVAHVHAINKNKYHKEIPASQTTDGVAEYYECANGCNNILNSKAEVITDEMLKLERLPITLIIDANGGEFSGGSKTKTYSVKYGSSYPVIESPVAREGYNAESYWYTDSINGSKVVVSGTVDLTTDTVLYAHWKGVNRTVSFNEDSTTYTIENGKSLYDSKKTIPKLNRNNKIFMGWYTEASGNGERFTDTTIVTSDMTLYPFFKDEGMAIKLNPTAYVYSGTQIKPEIVSVEYDGVALNPGTDYTVAYKNNIKAFNKLAQDKEILDKSAPTVVITGKGNYAGVYKKYFAIEPKNIGNTDVAIADIPAVLSTGRDIKPVPVVTWGKTKLVNNRDYMVEYYSDVDCNTAVIPSAPGTYFVKVEAKDGSNYTGKMAPKTFTIANKDNQKLVSKLTVTLPKTKPYSGDSISLTTEELIVKDGKDPLTYMADYSVTYGSNKIDIGTVPVTITGTGTKYVGSKTVTFQIAGTPLNKAKLNGFKPSLEYNNGAPVMQTAKFNLNGADLLGKDAAEYAAMPEGTDKREVAYTYKYENNTDIGKATVIYTGVNAYSGTIKKIYSITGKAMSTAKIKDGTFTAAYVYDGTPKKQSAIKVVDKDGNELKDIDSEEYAKKSASEKRAYDCVISYSKNTNAGTATTIVTGVNGYSGVLKKTFRISAFDIKENAGGAVTISLSENTYAYDKSGVTPEAVVSYNGLPLVKGSDYTVSYLNNKTVNDGTGIKKPTVKITGKGNFKGINDTKTFAISAKVLNSGGIRVVVSDKAANNKAGGWKSTVSVVDANGKKLTAGSDYSKVEYYYGYIPPNVNVTNGTELKGNGEIADVKDIVPAGVRIRVVVTGNGKNKNYSGSIEGEYRIGKTDINSLKFTIDPHAYTGSEITLSNSDIKWSAAGKAVEGVDFAIDRYSYKNNVKKGKATVVVKGTGEYCGTRTLTFNIVSRTLK